MGERGRVCAALTIVACLAMTGGAGAQEPFSLASVSGRYAGIFSGTFIDAGQVIHILGTGIFIADGNGNLRGHETYTVGTQVCDADISGTYTVARDGTGTNAITYTGTTPGCGSGSYTQSLAIAKRGELIMLANTNGELISEEWRRQR